MRQLSRQRNKPGPGVVLSPRRCADRRGIVATCAGAPLAGRIVMHRHLGSRLGPLGPGLARIALVVLVALGPGCKSMGGMMSGLGKVAAGAARGVAHAAPAVARGVAHASGAVAKGVVRSTPTVLRATEAVIETAAEVAWAMPTEIEVDLGPGVGPPPGARPGDDPCQTCPVDDCGACTGYAGYACVASPAGALARCESSAPPDAPPAPEPPTASPPPPPSAIPSSAAIPSSPASASGSTSRGR
jgi:hypothetical protein